jgi:uncharacterized protein
MKFQRVIARRLIKERPSVPRGIGMILGTLSKARPRLDWETLRSVDWEQGQRRWVRWFEDLLKHVPPPSIALLWIEVPSEINPALTSVSAWAELGPRDESFGAEGIRVWPIKRNGLTHDRGLLFQPELDKARAKLGWNPKEPSDDDRLAQLVMTLDHCYTLLLALNGLPQVRRLATPCAGKALGVTIGTAEGDISAVGGFGASGWKPFPRVPPSTQSKVLPEAMPPWDVSGYPLKYLKRGGSPKWRDPENGDSLLHAARHYDPSTVRGLVERGVDVNAKNDGGFTVLQSFGAAEIPILRCLLDHGANPRLRHPRGITLLDGVLDDGRCTVEHLKLVHGLGIGWTRGTPIHAVAESGVYERSRSRELLRMLVWWLDHGEEIDANGKRGCTPLWTALKEHASELETHVKDLRKDKDLAGTWDYSHDAVAMMLLENGANPNARLKKCTHRLIPANATPLMVRRYDDASLVRCLLKHGADPFAMCAKGQTALDYARHAARTPKAPGHGGVPEVVAILERAMRKPEVPGRRTPNP